LKTKKNCIIEIILRCKANFNVIDSLGYKIIHVASQFCDENVINSLFKYGSNINDISLGIPLIIMV